MEKRMNTRRGNRNQKGGGGLLLDPQSIIVTMRRSRIAIRCFVSAIVICIAYGLLSDYGIMTRSILDEYLPVTESSLPSNMVHSPEEGGYPPLGDGDSKITLEEQEQTRLLELPKEVRNGPLRGGERQVSTQEGEREDVSDGGHTPLQDNESDQSEVDIQGETNDHDAAVFSRNQTEKPPFELEEREDVSTEVHTPLQDGESEEYGATHYGKNKTMICFATCVFGESVEKADKPPGVENIFPNEGSDYDFFLFTNLKNLTSPGWTNIVLPNLSYRRFITQSRWGKFVGWRHKGLANCGTVIYMDAYVRPQTKKGLAPFRSVAKMVANSDAGLAQVVHPWNDEPIDFILQKIVLTKKDVAANTNATMRWFREQPDFDNRMVYWFNKWFAYDPSNPRFQEVSSFFWDRYSQELDSWRDQPLWSYSLHHFKIKPATLYKRQGRRRLFIEYPTSKGFGGHIHDESNDHDAARTV